MSNAIKSDHQEYLKLGGLGFLLGDGKLNYAREDIVEGYYNVHAWRGVFYALDAQYIDASGVQPGPRAGAGGVGADACGLLADLAAPYILRKVFE